jgi:hypothetical protein
MRSLPAVIDPQFTGNVLDPPAEESVVIRHRPIGSLSGATKVDFEVLKTSNFAIDLAATQFGFKFAIKKKDGTSLAALATDKHLSVANLIHSSFFSSINVSLNGYQVANCANHNYYSYILSQLSYTADYKKSILRSAGYEDETAATVGKATGTAFKNLAAIVEKSNEVYVINRIDSPLFLQKKFLPPDIQLSLSFSQSSPGFFLQTNLTDDLRVEILDAELFVRFVRIRENLLSALQEQLNSKAYIIPILRNEVRTITLATGLTSYAIPNLHLNLIPHRVIFALVPTTNYQGSLTTSPFAFNHCNLTDYTFSLNNVSIPLCKLNFDFSKKNAIEIYNHVNRQLNLHTTGTATPSLSYDKFLAEWCFFAQCFHFDTSANQLSGPDATGCLGLNLSFGTALTSNTTLIIISEFSKSQIHIEKDIVRLIP